MTSEILDANENTLPKLLLRHRERFHDRRVALREKDRGIWKRYTRSDYYLIVESLAAAFLAMGLKKDEKVSIIGENKPHVYWFELGAQVCRAPVVGIFSDCSADEIKYFLTHSDSRFVVCQDQEQVDKLLEIKDEVPGIRKVIYWEEKGMWSYTDPWLVNMDEMMEGFAAGMEAMTEGMKNAHLKIAVTFPGEIVESNATKIEGKTAIWEYTGPELMMGGTAEEMTATVRQ